jgi:membrane protein DedA with SNARE-associated domain
VLTDLIAPSGQFWLWPYAVVLGAAAVEGEVAYVAAATLVAMGRLNAFGVCAAGAVGAAIGDQIYFYVCRGRLQGWLERYPAVQRKAAPLVERVRQHDWLWVLLIRFAPGLRIAIAVACAWADVSPRRFTAPNFLSAVVWATALIILVGWFGPTYLAPFGLDGWKGALAVGAVIVGAFALLGIYERRKVEHATSRNPTLQGL